MTQQVLEQSNHFHATIVVERGGEGVVPLIKSIVEVVTDEAETAILLTAVCLDIVVGPIVVAKVQLSSHIVGELIHVEQGFHFVVDTSLVDTAAQFDKVFIGNVCAVLELTILKHVYLVVIVAVVGIDKLVVGWFTQV